MFHLGRLLTATRDRPTASARRTLETYRILVKDVACDVRPTAFAATSSPDVTVDGCEMAEYLHGFPTAGVDRLRSLPPYT
jgi:hypothetical protein